jgi:TolB-like protein
MGTQPRPPDPPRPASQDRLDSWKEIAAHLKRDVRTVQRWEDNEGLPIHRHQHSRQGSVYAYTSELNDWWQARRPEVDNGSPGTDVELVAETSSFKYPHWMIKGATAAAGVVVLLSVVLWTFVRARTYKAMSPDRPAEVALAVLPFESISQDNDENFLADGLSDDVTTDLGRFGKFSVISRTSTLRFKGVHKPLQEIAQQLGATMVVEGTIVRSGERVRITAQLIDAKTDRHLWAGRYERAYVDLLSLEDDVASTVATEIRDVLQPGRHDPLAPAGRVDAEARANYLKGRYYWNQRNEDGLKIAIQYFNHAIEREPDYAPAYVGLADSYNLLSVWGAMPPRETFPKARETAEKAIQLDPSSAQAYTSLAFVTYRFYWDWDAAERDFQEAVKLDPNYSTAHQWYGEFLADMARFDQGLDELKRARALDPLSLIAGSDLAVGLFRAHQEDGAIAEVQEILAMEPNYVPAHLYLGSFYEGAKRYAQAEAEFSKFAELTGEDGNLLGLRARMYAAAGEKEKARRIVDDLLSRSREGRYGYFQIAVLYAGIGEKELALAALQRAYDEHSWWMVTSKVEPAFDSIRSEPRFQHIMKQVGLDGRPN